MQFGKCIYCIEGHWNGEGEVDPSVEPILQMLASLGQWQYARRDCATKKEMWHWLGHEWRECEDGSVLYLATHGASGSISLSEGAHVPMAKVGKWNCTNCWVHFGGCSVLDVADETISQFMTNSGATVVSGYAGEIGWTSTTYAPALALELMLFSSAHSIKIQDGRSRRRFKEIADNLSDRFKDCRFRLHTKESVGL